MGQNAGYLSNNNLKNLTCFLLASICVFAITYLFSLDMLAGTASSNAISNTLCRVVNLLTGTAGKAIAAIGLICLAIGLFFGKLSWGMAIAIALGIGGIFGAQGIVNYISGGIGNANCQSVSFATHLQIAYLSLGV